MCNCLSFLVENPTLQEKWEDWAQCFSLFLQRFQSSSQSLPSTKAHLLRVASSDNLDASLCEFSHPHIYGARLGDNSSNGLMEKCGVCAVRRRCVSSEVEKDSTKLGGGKPVNAMQYCGKDDEKNEKHLFKPSQSIEIMQQRTHVSQEITGKMHTIIDDMPCRMRIPKTIMNGGDDTFSAFTQQGLKGPNQDCMLVWEDFIPSQRAFICGVFDGHGPHGHHVSRNVRDILPAKIVSSWQTLQASAMLARRNDSPEKLFDSRGSLGGDPDHVSLWEETFHNAYDLMDRELWADEDVDCVYSGSTAVTLIKQGSDLIIANVGDSRAVLGVQLDSSVLALQLTTDLTPNLPKEAERIRHSKGRVLAMRKEPFVKRVWLPHENSPGLAMSRAFGDYIVKNYGVISVPEVTHRRISKNDKFVVLATDGVWDVLSNEQVVRIVDSCPVRSHAAQAVVDTAVSAWKVTYPDAKVDDCAVVCLFLDSFMESWQGTNSPW